MLSTAPGSPKSDFRIKITVILLKHFQISNVLSTSLLIAHTKTPHVELLKGLEIEKRVVKRALNIITQHTYSKRFKVIGLWDLS